MSGVYQIIEEFPKKQHNVENHCEPILQRYPYPERNKKTNKQTKTAIHRETRLQNIIMINIGQFYELSLSVHYVF